jgi:uncharacterized protein (DUF302 family)
MTMPSNDRPLQPEVNAKPESPSYGFHAHLGKTDFAATVERVSAALKNEGFGILTEIDVQATMKNKLASMFPHIVFSAPAIPHWLTAR